MPNAPQRWFCNLRVHRFIPSDVNLRVVILLASLCAGTLLGQAPQAGASGASGSTPANGGAAAGSSASTPGILQTPANRNSGSRTRRGNGGRGRTNNPSANSSGGPATGNGGTNTGLPPAADANSRIVITGIPSANATGTEQRPLLPIVGVENSLGIASGTPILVKLRSLVDSGHARNGDMIDGTLAAPIGKLPVGTPVRLTVVQSAPAGSIASYGELSIQVVSIADRRILSDTITAIGKTGAQELPDAAPARGTEAVFSPDQTISLPTA